jgi:cell division protein ZapA
VDSNKVEILGRQYNIAGIGDRAYLEKLARYVDSQMRQIVETTGTVDTLKVAILAALNMADCYFRAEADNPLAEAEMERRITALSEKIEKTLSS